MKVRLEVIAGQAKDQVFEFVEPGGFTFGRAADCNCVVEDDHTISRRHFYLEINPPSVLLRDLGSHNGTFVDDVRCGGAAKEKGGRESSGPVPLRDGARIRAGKQELLLTIEGAACCVECGADIPLDERASSEFAGGAYLCAMCRTDVDTRISMGFAPGRAAKNSSGWGMLNPAQRLRAEEDSSAVVSELVSAFAEGRAQDEPPDIDGYQIVKELGRGGFGMVYEATRIGDGQRVALKMMLQTRRPPENRLLLFEREMRICQQLRHANIVHCERTAKWGDVHFLEMEYMEGGSLSALLDRQGRLTLQEARPILLQVIEALAFAHAAELDIETAAGQETVRGAVHRNIKPQNILLSGTPRSWVAKISDFGLAKGFAEAGMTKGAVTVTGGYAGTPCYTAREHLIHYRFLKPSTDVFEAAATFYHMLAGRAVWPGASAGAVIRSILEGKISPIREVEPSIPDSLARVIDKALSREPESRFSNAGAMLTALETALD